MKYRPLSRGASMDMDTYESHLWFFKALHGSQVNKGSDRNGPDMIKLLAIPEEILGMDDGISHLKSYFKDPNDGSSTAHNNTIDMSVTFQDAAPGLSNLMTCSLCKYVVRSQSRELVKIPCPHFTGEAKFSVSDLICRSWSSFNPTYIYSCTTKTHRKDHSSRRRNIYLVEPFYNLRERCFLALSNRISHSDLLEMSLPTSLQEDYIQFMTTLKKVDESNENSNV